MYIKHISETPLEQKMKEFRNSAAVNLTNAVSYLGSLSNIATDEESISNQTKLDRAKEINELTVTIDDMTFDGDEVAQNRMMRQILIMDRAADTTDWILADGSVAEVTKSQLKSALKEAKNKQTEIWLKYNAKDEE